MGEKIAGEELLCIAPLVSCCEDDDDHDDSGDDGGDVNSNVCECWRGLLWHMLPFFFLKRGTRRS